MSLMTTARRTAIPDRKSARRGFASALLAARETVRWSQELLGREVGVSQAAVAAWENCVNEPPSEMVFKLEQKLALRPGALSSHLGYLPLSVTASRAKPDTIEAILRDSHLGEVEKKAMLGLYRSLAPRAR